MVNQVKSVHMNTVWHQNVKGKGRIQSENLKMEIAIPLQMGGSGEGADPQQLLVSAAVACYTMTLTFMLDDTQIPVTGLFMDTEGTTTNGDQVSIVHYPHVVLSSEASEEDVAKVQGLILKAEEQCRVGQLLTKAGVSIEVDGKVSVDTRRRYSK